MESANLDDSFKNYELKGGNKKVISRGDRVEEFVFSYIVGCVHVGRRREIIWREGKLKI